jgi:hypothetical protein
MLTLVIRSDLNTKNDTRLRGYHFFMQTTMKYCIIFLLTVFYIPSVAQPARAAYNQYIIMAETARFENRMAAADSLYALAFAKGVRALKQDFIAAAATAASLEQWPRCFILLDSAVLRGLSNDQLVSLPFYKKLYKQNGWKTFRQGYPTLRRRYKKSLNQALQKQLAKMLEQDQQYRDGTWEKYHKHNRQVMNIDSLNFEQLKAIVQKHGWPGFSLIGDAGETKREMNDALFIIMHFQVPQKQFFLPYIMEAAAKGEAYPVNAAHLTDRICMDDGFKPQQYGSLTFTGKDRVKRIYPVNTSDITILNARRAQIGLPPVQLSAKAEGALWEPGYSIEQFKAAAGMQ